jgi:hypothetical protein
MKYLMACVYSKNRDNRKGSLSRYRLSSRSAVVIIESYFTSIIIITYPFLYVFYNQMFNVVIFAFILFLCYIILPFILRWLVTENDLINYIETLPASRIKRDCRIIKWTLLFLNFLVFILCIYFYLNYIEGVVK